MVENLYKRAYDLQQEINQQKKHLKEMEAEFDELIVRIRSEQTPGIEFALEPKIKPIRRAQPEFFRKNFSEFYARYAHLSHSHTVSLLSDMLGGYDTLQSRIRAARPDEFAKHCIITIDDVATVFGNDGVDNIEASGGIIRDEPKSFKVVALPVFMAEINRRKVAEVK